MKTGLDLFDLVKGESQGSDGHRPGFEPVLAGPHRRPMILEHTTLQQTPPEIRDSIEHA